MAKKFFYVCGGLLLLTLTYHVGARSATAQSGAVGFSGSQGFNGGSALVAYSNGDVYYYDPGCGNCGGWRLRSNVFGGNAAGRSIVQFDKSVAVASSGEVFVSNSELGSWSNLGVPPGGVTGEISTSWGAVKARYR